jgi:subtilisin family serine protease
VAPGVDVLSTVRRGDGLLSGVSTPGGDFQSAALNGSARGIISGPFVFCGLGRAGEVPAAVSGRIAVIRRGEIKFAEKARRAKEAGATAVVIVNNNGDPLNFTLIDPEDPTTNTYPWPVTVAVTEQDGALLLDQSNASITVLNSLDDYDTYQGTSMAAPHVAGVAALVWSVAPNATASEVVNALTSRATDLGAPGDDVVFGFGLVTALEPAKLLNPGAFGLPSTPPPSPGGRRRSVGH